MWFFKRTQQESEKPDRLTTARFVTADIIEIPSIDLTGRYRRSPNGAYVLAWADFDPSGRVGGYRKSGYGRYVLLHNGVIVASGQLERPNDGHVANNGTFVLSDGLFGDVLGGYFCIFGSDGSQLVRHRFTANLFSSGISDDGTYAVCQLCNSDTDDGGKLVFFDVVARRLLWKIQPETGWAQLYHFDAPKRTLGLAYRDLGTFAYTFEGTFVDQQRWEEAQIRSGTGYAVLAIARERCRVSAKPLSEDDAAHLLHLIAVAAERLSKYPKELAQAERLAGEVYEATGNLGAARERYQTALGLDPRCGVKQRLKALEKMTGQRD